VNICPVQTVEVVETAGKLDWSNHKLLRQQQARAWWEKISCSCVSARCISAWQMSTTLCLMRDKDHQMFSGCQHVRLTAPFEHILCVNDDLCINMQLFM
jgi:hypothetical protein